MQTLESELKAVITRRLEAATSREVLAIASSLCNGERATDAAGPIRWTDAESVTARFNIGPDVVHDNSTGLTWSRANMPGGQMNWKAAGEACAALELDGFSDWRLPTIRELLTIVDYDRHEPAIDTDAFKCDSAYYWSSTPVHSSPGVCAWLVSFGNGSADWHTQDVDYQVRAVRSSQSFDLWHVR